MLTVEALTKTYKTGDKALRSVSFTVPKGQVVGLIGPSGAGKSTLIRCINRLVEPSEGRVLLNDLDITGLPAGGLRRARRQIGMIFQEYALVERLSVMENVLSGRLGYVGFWRSFLRRFPGEDVENAFRLLDRVADGPEEGARLARAAVRYFLVSADAENDFAVGGLDDDAAVLNAVAHHLGHEDCLVQLAPADTSRGWIVKLPRGPVRDLFAHVASYGSITEPEALGMLGCARELRRFARRFETHTAHLPFRVRIEILDGVKRYVREGTRS